MWAPHKLSLLLVATCLLALEAWASVAHVARATSVGSRSRAHALCMAKQSSQSSATTAQKMPIIEVGRVWASFSAALLVSATLSTCVPTLSVAFAADEIPGSDLRGIARFERARDDLKALDKNWDAVTAKGGDGVRRQLGTAYAPPKCLPALCSWNLFVDKFVRTDDVDISEFDGPSLELQQALTNADFLAYSSVFSDYGNGGGGSEGAGGSADLLENSRKQINIAVKALDKLIDIVAKGE